MQAEGALWGLAPGGEMHNSSRVDALFQFGGGVVFGNRREVMDGYAVGVRGGDYWVYYWYIGGFGGDSRVMAG